MGSSGKVALCARNRAVGFGPAVRFWYSYVHMLKQVSRALLFVFSVVTVFAQGTTSRILGTVQDASGAVVPAATVKLVNEGTRVTFETQTSTNGAYFFEAVQPGNYGIVVEANGFRKFESHKNRVAIGQPTTVLPS